VVEALLADPGVQTAWARIPSSCALAIAVALHRCSWRALLLAQGDQAAQEPSEAAEVSWRELLPEAVAVGLGPAAMFGHQGGVSRRLPLQVLRSNDRFRRQPSPAGSLASQAASQLGP